MVGICLAELNETWRKLLPILGAKTLVVDLQDVTFADSEGLQLLRNIYRKTGSRFLANTPMTKHIAEQAMNGARGEDF
jgi:anti-anti-sigma regulatory factor